MTPERTALKEWAVLVDAMASGEICAMIRKGGIREQRAGFSIRHDQFLLYPTFFHEKVEELAPRLRHRLPAAHAARPPAGQIVISHLATVHAVWHVTELDALRAIENEHGMAWNAVESRFHYRNNPGVRVVALSLASLPRAVTVPETRRYLGCVSWVELDEGIEVSAAAPIIPAENVARRIDVMRQALGEPNHEEVQA
jgi:hypothetical protein